MSRIMAIDWGERRVGIALSDEGRTIASPHSVLKRSHSLRKDMEKISSLIEQSDVGMVVVGIPRQLNGTLGLAAERILEVVQKFKDELGVPVKTWDERLSTAEAQKILIDGDVSRKKRKGAVDRIAAALFLQTFLDSGVWRES
ncbi:Holliday junction resolvase RuvX [bacterium]|nr:MAG: Holliday junction resolvase RuvX [bacterium]